jgi:hypothetical protein
MHSPSCFNLPLAGGARSFGPDVARPWMAVAPSTSSPWGKDSLTTRGIAFFARVAAPRYAGPSFGGLRRLLPLLLAVLSSLFPAGVQAAWPERPVTVIVPFPAGGVTDLLARITAQRLSSTLGKAFVVDNVAGAAGTLATSKAARARLPGRRSNGAGACLKWGSKYNGGTTDAGEFMTRSDQLRLPWPG